MFGGGVRYIRTLEKKMHSIIVVVVRLVVSTSVTVMHNIL